MIEPADFAFVGRPCRESVAVEAVDSYDTILPCFSTLMPLYEGLCLLNLSVGPWRI